MAFEDTLSALVSKEAAEARGDADRMGAMVERLARALGFTIALACRGNGPAIDKMVAGAEGYIHGEAVEKAHFVAFMERHSPPSQPDGGKP